MKSLRLNLDALGMCASMRCMFHCMAFPLLLAALPMLQLAASEANDDAGRQLAVADSRCLAAATPSIQCSDQECCTTASVFGGGGHVKAAGATMRMSVEEAIEAVEREVRRVLNGV